MPPTRSALVFQGSPSRQARLCADEKTSGRLYNPVPIAMLTNELVQELHLRRFPAAESP